MKPAHSHLPPLLSVLVLGMLSSGCVNDFQQSYKRSNVSSDVALLPYSGSTQLIGSGNLRVDEWRLQQEGYVLIGVASFHAGGEVSADEVKEQARAVGADVVLWSNKYGETRQEDLPFTQNRPAVLGERNAYGTVNPAANAYGSSGNSNGPGAANLNAAPTPAKPDYFGSDTAPVTIQTYEYTAEFFRKAESLVFGAFGSKMPEELRQRYRRNGGVVVSAVAAGSPAFKSNILPGDVIIKINDLDVNTVEEYNRAINAERGNAPVITFIRDGEIDSVSVIFNP
jgi:hypothetical protein